MSIDYVRCFDLLPQAPVLALVLEPSMDPRVARALGAMYKQLRRAFKVAGCLGAWWWAINGILQGFPLSVILVNVLITIWKWEVDAVREQVCVATVALPRALVAAQTDSESDQHQCSNSAEELELHVQLRAQGPRLAALGASGYAADTQAVAPGTAALQRTAPTTEAWLTLTWEGRPHGQVLLLVEGGGGGAGSAIARPAHTGSRLFPPAGGGGRRGWRPQHKARSHNAWKPAAACCDVSCTYPSFSGGCMRSTPW